MPNPLVRDVPAPVMASLKKRAAENRRSVQKEMLEILERATQQPKMTAVEEARMIRERLAEKGIDVRDSSTWTRTNRSETDAGSLAERLMAIGRDFAAHLDGPATSADHAALLYGERG
ncbi:MAG: FitA-like ribbon-helix-helix domain-containing protein [Chloroflexota bacterium]